VAQRPAVDQRAERGFHGRPEGGHHGGLVGHVDRPAGDLPADFLAADAAPEPRRAMASFAERWRGLADGMLEGKEHPTLEIGRPETRAELGDLLRRRADLLADFARDDQYW